MDNIPYEFIDKVLTHFDYSGTEKIRLNSALWTACARVYSKKRRYLKVNLFASSDGLKYSIMTLDHRDHFAFDLVRRLDCRFNQIREFSAYRISPRVTEERTCYDLPASHLPQFIEFLCHFRLKRTMIVFPQEFQKVQKLIMEFLSLYGLQTNHLVIGHSIGSLDFLKNQLKMEELTTLTLYSKWPRELKQHLMAFIKQPQFLALEYFDDQTYFGFLMPTVIAARSPNYPSVHFYGWPSALFARRPLFLKAVLFVLVIVIVFLPGLINKF